MRGGRGGFRGNFRGGNRGGFRGRGRGQSIMEIPDRVEVLGEFTHVCEDMIVCKATHKDAPLINRPVFTEDKKIIGMVDEVFGPTESFGFSIKPNQGFEINSLEAGQNVYVNPSHLKPTTFFQSKPKPPKLAKTLNMQGLVQKIAKGPNSISKFGGFRGGFQRGRGGFQRGQGGFQRGQGGFQRGQGGFQRGQGGFQRRQGGFQRGHEGFSGVPREY